MTEHSLKDASFSVIVRPSQRLTLLGCLRNREGERLDRQFARLMKIEFIHGIEGLQAVGDRMLRVCELDVKRAELVVAAGVRRTMFPDSPANQSVKFGPGVGGFGVGQGRMPRAVSEVNDRQPAAAGQVARQV